MNSFMWPTVIVGLILALGIAAIIAYEPSVEIGQHGGEGVEGAGQIEDVLGRSAVVDHVVAACEVGRQRCGQVMHDVSALIGRGIERLGIEIHGPE